jgi:hypothetical protein
VSTILDALRKAQAEGDQKPDAPTPDFPPSFAEGPPLPPDDADGARGGGFEKETPPRSYRMIAVVVLGVSLGLLLGRLLLPLATAPPDSSGMLADGVAEKHEDLLVAAKEAADAERSPAELRSEKREEARAERRRKRGRETADSRPDESADRIGGADAAAKPAVMPDAVASPKDAIEAGAVGDAADSEGSRPATSDADGDRVAAARQQASSSGVPVPPTLPRPESPPLPGIESAGTPGAVASVEPVDTDGGGPRVLGNVVSPPAAPSVADMEVPPGLDSLGRDPLATTVVAVPPSEAPVVLEPVTTPPPPAANAPKPRSLPNAPDDAPKIWLLFIQWSSTPEKRVVSLRQEGGSISVLREGDIVQGMRLAAIRRSGVEFQWRGQSFLVPVSRY